MSAVLGLEMETSSHELITGSNISKPQRRQIVRGKRTERSRPLTAVTSSSSTGCTGGGNDAYFSIPSPTSSGQNNSTCTEEDENMASCLILLAQSASSPKLIGQKFTETATTTATTGKTTGFYVYECKTCNRNFPSFQALGGHRASHKKPRVPIPPEKNNKVLNATLNHKDGHEDVQSNKVISPSIFSNKPLQSGTNKAKVHECSICRSKFASGQALGGHMRRHRITTPTNGNSSNITEDQHNKPIRNILQLDLNLPAPEDDDHVGSKFPFVFSAQALVGCHY